MPLRLPVSLQNFLQILLMHIILQQTKLYTTCIITRIWLSNIDPQMTAFELLCVPVMLRTAIIQLPVRAPKASYSSSLVDP